MIEAYILIQTDAGMAPAVTEAATAIPGVLEAKSVTGPYDVIVRAEGRTVDDLGRLVVAQIQRIEGIYRTLTCPVVEL
jgi:DNA-binding Lrp family transcriptional regulator